MEREVGAARVLKTTMVVYDGDGLVCGFVC